MSAWWWGAIWRGLAPFVAIIVAVLLGWLAWHAVAWAMDTLFPEET